MKSAISVVLILFITEETKPDRPKVQIYYKHMGCYIEEFRPDGNAPWFFHFKYHRLISPSLSVCLLHCVIDKFMYAAIDKKSCGCGKVMVDEQKGQINKTDDEECSSTCTQKPFEKVACGADNRQSLYKIKDASIIWIYVGCYKILPLDQSKNWKPLQDNSPFYYENNNISEGVASDCMRLCSRSGYKYAAVYAGANCGCDNEIKNKTEKVSDMLCTYPCIDLKMGTCGALKDDFVSIYRTDTTGMKYLKRAMDREFLSKGSADGVRLAKVSVSPSMNTTNTTEKATEKGVTIGKLKLTKDAIIGISVGGGVLFVLIIAGICYCIKKRKSDDNEDDDEDLEDDEDDDEYTKRQKARKRKAKAKKRVADIKKAKKISTKGLKVPKLKYQTDDENTSNLRTWYRDYSDVKTPLLY